MLFLNVYVSCFETQRPPIPLDTWQLVYLCNLLENYIGSLAQKEKRLGSRAIVAKGEIIFAKLLLRLMCEPSNMLV